jgi:hypothetical protein
MTEPILDVASGDAIVQRAADPVAFNVVTPADFAAQYPTPLDPTEIISMCEEINLLNAIPEYSTGLQTELWREMTSLNFNSGTNYIAFLDGTCPEEYKHDGENKSVDLKSIGAKKSLTDSDIIHSRAVATGGSGIRALNGPGAHSSGMPGGTDANTIGLEAIADLKAKEIKLGMALVLNGEDRLLAVGDAVTRPLEFSGIQTQVTAVAGAHANILTGQNASGTFSANNFDAFLGEGCAKPTTLFGAPQAIQTMMSGYFQLGFQGSQLLNFNSGAQIVPGYSFAGFVQTGVGRLQVVADSNFTKTAAPNGANSYNSTIYALRMSHNGAPFVYRATQIGLQLKDLAPGCTSISFLIYKKTALIVKAMCSQALYTFSEWPGRNLVQCTSIG